MYKILLFVVPLIFMGCDNNTENVKTPVAKETANVQTSIAKEIDDTTKKRTVVELGVDQLMKKN